MCFEIYDQILGSLKSRFETDSVQFFKSLESFIIGGSNDARNIIKFNQDDFEEDRVNDRGKTKRKEY